MEKKSKAETFRKKAELDTELDFLDAQKDLATVEAELRAMQEMDIDNLSRKSIQSLTLRNGQGNCSRK
jgi:hypothetical protein